MTTGSRTFPLSRDISPLTQRLDAFLELKLENERLREELKELQQDLEDEDIRTSSHPVVQSYTNKPAIPRPLEPLPQYQASSPSPSSPTPSSASSSNSSPALKNNKPVKKRQKKVSVPGPGGTGKGEAEGLHVCVTCGRTDSPEWRKGPLGPKTLCNVCPTLHEKTMLIFRHVVYDGQSEIVRLLVERKRNYWQKRRSSKE